MRRGNAALIRAVGASLLASGCCDRECEPDTLFELALPAAGVSATATVEFSRSIGGRAVVSCTLTSGAEDEPWACTPRPSGSELRVDSVQLRYKFDDPARWFVRLSGPSDMREFERPATSDDPGEGWPVGCAACYDYTLRVERFDLASIGVRVVPAEPPPTFGEPCLERTDCGSGLFCGPQGGGATTCTRGCFFDSECPEGFVCAVHCSVP